MYQLQESKKSGYWVCTDTEHLIVCVFKEHAFNEDQKFTVLEDCKCGVAEMASIVRKMGDWLKENHYNKIF